MGNDHSEDFGKFEELFWNVTRDMGRIWKDIFISHFPGSQSQLVFTLARKGRLKMSELAKILGLTAGAVTAASDKLIENGYVLRIRDDKDRRIIYLEITDKGRKELQQLRLAGRRKMAEAFAGMDAAQLEVMLIVFEQAATNISAMKGLKE
ncbi:MULTISPECIES: MarR family winged helix-turn-helix transcriptional regulator [Sporosarcina]|uniref:MarR family winged helix-turn-helix transcriptional regulator n=1 Tax=Sporosarcina TaxID=1569 RepID=UPI000694A2C1|nr:MULTISPECIES: MarR family transcriptional regulator [Sporosarcina]WJY28360.1 MarR family transcriptional regulator [Sporosarcina sp. 0.2-SM1T-5]